MDDRSVTDEPATVDDRSAVDEDLSGVDEDLSTVDDDLRHLLDRDDVVYEESATEYEDPETYETARERAADLKGAVVVAVTNDAGEVLLVENDWMDGFGFPGGGVEPGEAWADAAVREVREETGVAVELDQPWRVHGGPVTCGDRGYRGLYSVHYRASPVGDETVADDPGTAEETIEAVGWFGAVPERAMHPALLATVLDGPADGR